MITKAVPARARTRTFSVGIDYITEHTRRRALAAAGVTFKGGVTYASAPEKAAWVHHRGVTSVETAAIEMEAVAALSSRCRDPAYHLIIAYAKHERPTRDQVVSDAERLLKAVGMDGHQYVLAAHRDTDDFHAHVIANRVGSDGRANDLWHDRIIRERLCAEIAAERGWDIVVGHHNRDIIRRIERLHDLLQDPERRLSDGAYRRLHERGELPWYDVARSYVLDAVDRARDWSDLHQRLAAHGVVVKLVQRGERAQGLAFSEGLDCNAPGCAASRIDRRCALKALEARFGPFTPLHERSVTNERSMSWADRVRASILTAIDEASSWENLQERLAQDSIVIKLVQRGGHVQGFAFVHGYDTDAPGCSASRLDPRCEKAALEQGFGPFPNTPKPREERTQAPIVEDRTRSRRGTLRERVERDARRDPNRAVSEASYIANHARIRSAYAAYRNAFFEQRKCAMDARRNAAWSRERLQRQLEAKRRRQARQLLRAVARLGTRGLIARQLAYWSIEAVLSRRQAKEYDVARIRWEATKIILGSERQQARKEKVMDYRSFVAERARTGDSGAQRVLEKLMEKSSVQQRTNPIDELSSVTLSEVRAHIEVLRAKEADRYEQARAERERLQPVALPPSFDTVVKLERVRIEKHIADAIQFTEVERAQLASLAKDRRSSNPSARSLAEKSEADLRDAHRSRYGVSLTRASRELEECDLLTIFERVAADARRYRQYISSSLDLEAQMRDARTALRKTLPVVEHQLTILERCGAPLLVDLELSAGLNCLAASVDRHYRTLPEPARRDAERALRREERERSRSRESLLISR